MFTSENHSHRPFFMYIAQKILKLAFVLRVIAKKLHFWGRINLTCFKSANLLKGSVQKNGTTFPCIEVTDSTLIFVVTHFLATS